MLSHDRTEAPVSEYRVMTVHGPRRMSADWGYVLPHEHILIDLRVWWEGDDSSHLLDPPGDDVVPERYDQLRRHPHEVCRENLVISDWYVAAKELRHAVSSGCQLLVDLTTSGLGPMPAMAARAADLAGLSLTIGVGRYVADSLPVEELEQSTGELVDVWQSAVDTGIDGCSVGVIGEIGTSLELAEPEERSLLAAAQVQRQTGLAINVHLHPYGRQGARVLDVLERGGADLARVALSHCDGNIDVANLLELLRRGCYVEFDSFGYTSEWHVGGQPFPSDGERVDAVVQLCERGHEQQLLLSQDICHRISLRRYGGWGYAHLAVTVVPQLLAQLDQPAVDTILRHNPLTLLTMPGATS